MSLLLTLFRSSPEQHAGIVHALIGQSPLFVDVTNYRQIDRLAVEVCSTDRKVSIRAKGVDIAEAAHVWCLGTPGMARTATLNGDAWVFASTEWNACFESCLRLLSQDVLVSASSDLNLIGPGHGARFLAQLGWKVSDIEMDARLNGSNRLITRREVHDEDEFCVVFTRKRWFLCHTLPMIIERTEVDDLLWTTWEALLEHRLLWSSLSMRVTADEVIADRFYADLPGGADENAWRTIVQDALY